MVKDMTRGNALRSLLTFALSYALTYMLSYIYSLTDSIMVSHYVSEHALGAIGAISPLASTLCMFFIDTVSGFSVLAGRGIGEGSSDKVSAIMKASISLTLISTVPIAILAMILTNPLMSVMNISDGFSSDSSIYFILSMIAMPLSVISALYASMFRALGDSSMPAKISIAGGFLNVVFNFIFLRVIPLGIAGAGLGTVCSSLVTIIAYIVIAQRGIPLLTVKIKELRLNHGVSRELLSFGVPLGLLGLITTSGSVLLQASINTFSDAVVTGISIGDKILRLVWMLICSFENALLFFGSQNAGAENYKRVRSGYRICTAAMLICGAVCAVLFITCGGSICRLFIGDAGSVESSEIIGYTTSYLTTQIVFFPFMALIASLRGFIKGVTLSRSLVFCGVVELLSRVAALLASSMPSVSEVARLKMIYMVNPIAWICVPVFLLILLIGYIKKNKELNIFTLK